MKPPATFSAPKLNTSPAFPVILYRAAIALFLYAAGQPLIGFRPASSLVLRPFCSQA